MSHNIDPNDPKTWQPLRVQLLSELIKTLSSHAQAQATPEKIQELAQSYEGKQFSVFSGRPDGYNAYQGTMKHKIQQARDSAAHRRQTQSLGPQGQIQAQQRMPQGPAQGPMYPPQQGQGVMSGPTVSSGGTTNVQAAQNILLQQQQQKQQPQTHQPNANLARAQQTLPHAAAGTTNGTPLQGQNAGLQELERLRREYSEPLIHARRVLQRNPKYGDLDPRSEQIYKTFTTSDIPQGPIGENALNRAEVLATSIIQRGAGVAVEDFLTRSINQIPVSAGAAKALRMCAATDNNSAGVVRGTTLNFGPAPAGVPPPTPVGPPGP
jgi:hypothetical protein